jgi:1-phosphofructokinase
LFDDFFEEEGIPHEFVRVAGMTRTGIKIVDEQADSTTDINFPGFEVHGEDIAALEAAVLGVVEPERWVVLAGSLPAGAPPDLYRRLSQAVRSGGGRVALDTSGAALGEALGTNPDLIKPNREELEELTGRSLGSREDLADAAAQLGREGIGTVVVSAGAEGALFARDGAAVFATPPRVKVASTVGAGDAMVAGTIAGTLRGLELAEVAALATAFSAVAISKIGPHLDAAAVRETAAAIAVEQLS